MRSLARALLPGLLVIVAGCDRSSPPAEPESLPPLSFRVVNPSDQPAQLSAHGVFFLTSPGAGEDAPARANGSLTLLDHARQPLPGETVEVPGGGCLQVYARLEETPAVRERLTAGDSDLRVVLRRADGAGLPAKAVSFQPEALAQACLNLTLGGD